MRIIKSYTLNVSSSRATFSVSLSAWDDDDAIEHVTCWARKARLAGDGTFKLVRADGSEVDVGEAVRPFLEADGHRGNSSIEA